LPNQATEKRKIKIPPHLGYGDQGAGNVPPKSELMFTVECMEIIQNQYNFSI